MPLAARTETLHMHLEQLGRAADAPAVLSLWHRVLTAPQRAHSPVWIHGDLHPGNLLIEHGQLAGVIDFGDLAAGDPATDLAVMWMFLPRHTWSTFVASAIADADKSLEHDATLMRARGWALALGLAYIANSRGDAAMSALGRATVTAALEG